MEEALAEAYRAGRDVAVKHKKVRCIPCAVRLTYRRGCTAAYPGTTVVVAALVANSRLDDPEGGGGRAYSFAACLI